MGRRLRVWWLVALLAACDSSSDAGDVEEPPCVDMLLRHDRAAGHLFEPCPRDDQHLTREGRFMVCRCKEAKP